MKITESIIINSPLDKVFDLFTDLVKIEKIIPGITKIEVLEGPSKMQEGTKWRETRVMFGKEATEEMIVTELQPNKSYTADAASHGMSYVSTYTFEQQGDTVKVNMVFEGRPLTLGAKLFTPIGLLFKGATKKALVADMKELKKAAELS